MAAHAVYVKKLITGVSIVVGKKAWCKEHFKCGTCKTVINSEKHREYKKNPICDNCYNQLTNYTCRKCKETIEHMDLVEALGHQYHTGCFVCSVGDHKLDDQEPYYEHKDLKIYCQTHYDELDKGEACQKCGKVLDTEYVKLGNKSYHSACWTCQKCSKPIKTKDAVQVQGQFFCQDCAKVDTKIHDRKNVTGRRLVPGYGDIDSDPDVVPPSASKRFPYKTLVLKRPHLPREVDQRQKEAYLTGEEFTEVFGCSGTEWNSYPTWKKLMLKKEKNLF